MQKSIFFGFFTNQLKNKKAVTLKLSPIDLKLNFVKLNYSKIFTDLAID
jgi:hypothetical protein